MKKKIFQFILLSLLSVLLLYEVIYSFNESDPWGLVFASVTLPYVILLIVVIFISIKTFLSLIKDDNKTLKKSEIFLMFIPFIIALGFLIFSFLSKDSKEIPENYIAVFHGGAGEITYETYIYKINNGQANYGFNYINTTNNTVSYGSNKINKTITKQGSVSWTDEVFKVAKDNHAYSYVTLPNDDKIYTVDEYTSMFVMN